MHLLQLRSNDKPHACGNVHSTRHHSLLTSNSLPRKSLRAERKLNTTPRASPRGNASLLLAMLYNREGAGGRPARAARSVHTAAGQLWRCSHWRDARGTRPRGRAAPHTSAVGWWWRVCLHVRACGVRWLRGRVHGAVATQPPARPWRLVAVVAGCWLTTCGHIHMHARWRQAAVFVLHPRRQLTNRASERPRERLKEGD